MGLLAVVRREDNGNLSWEVSRKGHDLYQLIFSQLLLSIKRAAA